MKFVKLTNNGKKMFIYGVIITSALFITINLFTSKSKYKVDDNIDLAEGTINYVIPDLKLMAVYVKEGDSFIKKDTAPSDATYQVVKGEGENTSYCVDIDGNKIDNVYMKYHEGKILIDVNKKGTKCWVYLEKATLLNEDILAKNKPKESTYNETYPYIAEFTKVATTDEGVFKMVDYDGEPTYYFRGAVEDNYVHFANFYWRIIRINSDGSIRMIYDGTKAHANGEESLDTQIEEISSYNTNSNDAKYVGFMYGGGKDAGSTGYDNANSNDTNSDVLNLLETWYGKNLLKYSSYIEENAIFCNDRRSGNSALDIWTEWLAAGSENKQGWGGASFTGYGARMRTVADNRGTFSTTQLADLSCQLNDRFTPKGARKGNKAMKYPIGLVTLDEVLMGGGFAGQHNVKYYLYTGQYYWTMSPVHFSVNANHANVYRVDGIYNSGLEYLLAGSEVSLTFAVRPVINLKADTTFSKGDGSMQNPYEIL